MRTFAARLQHKAHIDYEETVDIAGLAAAIEQRTGPEE